MGTPKFTREPCPDRLLDDVGCAFAMGAVGGSALHFIHGSRNSPKGERVLGGVQSVRMNSHRLAGYFAVWGGVFSAFDCAFVYGRQKEDPWNTILAGAATSGLLHIRKGIRASVKSAASGAAVLAMVEGAGIMVNLIYSKPSQTVYEVVDPDSGSWFTFQDHMKKAPPSSIVGDREGWRWWK